MKKLFTIILMIAGICFVANARKYKLDNEFFHNKTTWNSTNPRLPLLLKVTEDSNGNINIKAQYILYFFTGDTWRDENDDLRFNIKANIEGKEIVYTGKLYSDDPNAIVATGTFGGIDVYTVYNLDKKERELAEKKEQERQWDAFLSTDMGKYYNRYKDLIDAGSVKISTNILIFRSKLKVNSKSGKCKEASLRSNDDFDLIMDKSTSVPVKLSKSYHYKMVPAKQKLVDGREITPSPYSIVALTTDKPDTVIYILVDERGNKSGFLDDNGRLYELDSKLFFIAKCNPSAIKDTIQIIP